MGPENISKLKIVTDVKTHPSIDGNIFILRTAILKNEC